MKLAVCVLLAANGALALTPPKSAVAATRTGTAALETAVPLAAKEVSAVSRGGVIANFVGVDVALLSYFFFWYLGNYYYNISNKTALKAAGGALGYPMTISTLQLGVGSLYALFLWAAPDARSFPKVNTKDIIALLPGAFCAAQRKRA